MAQEIAQRPVLQIFEIWHRGLAEILPGWNSRDFPQRLLAVINSVLQVEEPLQLTIFKEENPYMVLEFAPDVQQDRQFREYLDKYFFLDPCYRAHVEQGYCGYYDFSQLAPSGFLDSDIFLAFHKSLCSDEIGCIFPFGDGFFANLSAARINNAKFSRTEKAFLRAIAPLVIELLQEHLGRVEGEVNVTGLESGKRQKMEQVLDSFGSELLSKKESEVLQLILRGYSMKAMADRLCRSLDTVKKHHRAIYNKLGISSQREIVPLLIQALELEDMQGDPLPQLLQRQD